MQDLFASSNNKRGDAYSRDPLELCLVCGESMDDEVGEYAYLLEASLCLLPLHAKIERLELESTLDTFEEDKAPQVKLNPLSSNLMYEFLRPKLYISSDC